jgi:uncharacterized protein
MEGAGELVNNENAGQFELLIGGSVCKMEYIIRGETFYLNHAKVPSGLEGEGIGSKLMHKIMHYIESHGGNFVPGCSFARDYVEKNPEWRRIMK